MPRKRLVTLSSLIQKADQQYAVLEKLKLEYTTTIDKARLMQRVHDEVRAGSSVIAHGVRCDVLASLGETNDQGTIGFRVLRGAEAPLTAYIDTVYDYQITEVLTNATSNSSTASDSSE